MFRLFVPPDADECPTRMSVQHLLLGGRVDWAAVAHRLAMLRAHGVEELARVRDRMDRMDLQHRAIVERYGRAVDDRVVPRTRAIKAWMQDCDAMVALTQDLHGFLRAYGKLWRELERERIQDHMSAVYYGVGRHVDWITDMNAARPSATLTDVATCYHWAFALDQMVVPDVERELERYRDLCEPVDALRARLAHESDSDDMDVDG